MKPHHLLPDYSFCLLILSMLAIPVALAESNRKPIANAGDDQVIGFSVPVILDGRRSVDLDGNIKKYQWTQIKGPKVTLMYANTARASFNSPSRIKKNQQPLTLVFRLMVMDNLQTLANDTVAVNIVLGKLNDTGITTCSNGINNKLTCPASGYPNQDAQFGRDKIHNDNKDGHAGFSFTKISILGKVLSTNAKAWSCVQDNVTGLMWEVKTDDGGLHDKDWKYSWYEPDSTKNGGNPGYQGLGTCGETSPCDTHAYTLAVNSEGYCGFKDWRMPTADELFGIVNHDYHSSLPAIDLTYFLNTPETSSFWSSTPLVNSEYAYIVFFGGHGYDDTYPRRQSNQVRLVRDAK